MRRGVARERAYLVSIDLREEDPFTELAQLVRSAGGLPVGRMHQKRQRPDPRSYIGSGKLRELLEAVEQTDSDILVIDDDLSPAQVRNLERASGRKVIDRSELILDLFATRARTKEAKEQVELAQLEYNLPRLRRMWTHLSRIEGGIGMRGPGERQIEVDRRLAQKRIQDLRESIRRNLSRRIRQVRSRTDVFTLSLIGYTNAGKSSLMNRLAGSGGQPADILFATLDTRTRRFRLPGGTPALASDTVGFLRKLPHHLISSFRATLEETMQADLLVHLVDASHPRAEDQAEAVERVLRELGCQDKPTLVVLNKIDRPLPAGSEAAFGKRYPRHVKLSCLTGEGMHELLRRMEDFASASRVRIELRIPPGDGLLLSYLHKVGNVLRQEIVDDRLQITAECDRHIHDLLLSRLHRRRDCTLTTIEIPSDRGGE
jgi:GTP-binding protein HflX